MSEWPRIQTTTHYLMRSDHPIFFNAGKSPQVTIICNDADYFLRHRRVIADTLVELGSEVTVLAGGRNLPSPSNRWYMRYVTVERFQFHPVHDLKLILTTLTEVFRRKIDSLHLITLKPAVMCGLTAILTRNITGYPKNVVITLPGLGRLMGSGSPTTASRLLTEWALRRMGNREDFQFTFETEHDRDICVKRRLVHPARASVINGAGVDPALFHPRADARQPGPLRILFASRLLRSKGLDAFLQAARSWARPGEVEFLVAGFADEGDTDAYRPEQLAAEPSIHFLGAVGNMPELLRRVDVVCLPTRYGEGISRILIEAAASGIAAIASDLEGCQVIVKNGETGVIVSAKDASASAAGIRSALERYLSDGALLERHSDGAFRNFLAGGYSEDAVVEQFIKLIAPRSSGQSARITPVPMEPSTLDV